MSGRRTSVLLVDDHAAIRLGMSMVLESDPAILVAGQAADGRGAVSMARALRPDVVLMDLRMPVMDGVEATRAIVAESLSVVLVLTTFDHDDYLFGALAAGAAGFLLKSAEPRDIVEAVHRVASGDQVISPAVTARVVAAALASGHPVASADRNESLSRLTGREAQVLECLGEGLSNHGISRTLGISETTVKTHVSRVLAKLSLSSRVQAALFIRAERGYTN